MIELRPFAQLGIGKYDWLLARYHFSFSHYHDPNRIRWGKIRVWNNDTINAQTGFAPHEHDNMEIITYVYKGAITHKDSLGNQGKTEAGQIQVMSAGSGIVHSEYNLEDESTQLFQIWLFPNQKNGASSWQTKQFPLVYRQGESAVLASGYAEEIEKGALELRANARLFALHLDAEQSLKINFSLKYVYMVSAKGSYWVNDTLVEQGDGVAIKDETSIEINAKEALDLVFVESE